MKCPAFQAGLVDCKNEFENFGHCGECGGTAVTLCLLRNFVAKETINALWRGVKDWDHPAKRCCIGGDSRMEAVPLNPNDANGLREHWASCCQSALVRQIYNAMD